MIGAAAKALMRLGARETAQKAAYPTFRNPSLEGMGKLGWQSPMVHGRQAATPSTIGSQELLQKTTMNKLGSMASGPIQPGVPPAWTKAPTMRFRPEQVDNRMLDLYGRNLQAQGLATPLNPVNLEKPAYLTRYRPPSSPSIEQSRMQMRTMENPMARGMRGEMNQPVNFNPYMAGEQMVGGVRGVSPYVGQSLPTTNPYEPINRLPTMMDIKKYMGSWNL